METIFTQTSLTVAKDGSGDYRTLQQALDQAACNQQPTTIYIQSGTYQENIKIYQDDLTLIGQGPVVIEGAWSAKEVLPSGDKRGTFQTATVFINAKAVTLANITIKNIAGPDQIAAQAVALYLEGTQITLKNCTLDAYQDTLCLGPLPPTQKDGRPLVSPWCQRHFPQQQTLFLDCLILGTVDFIFGGGQATFQHCQIQSRKRTAVNYLTAASTPMGQAGFVFINCQITGQSPYYLGRPWRNEAKTRFENCTFDDWLLPTGWHDWDKKAAHETTCYEEINNTYQTAPKRARWIKLEGASLDEKKT
ncbi:MAG: pectin esterase [Enterococcus sp.]|nr:pectin esterase [Enterococcus sp.]